MSLFLVHGFFSLAGGHIEKITGANAKTTSFIVYTSSLTCTDNTSAPIQIRFFSQNMDILPDYTVALIVGKAVLSPTSSPAMILHATHLFPVPGNPADQDVYEASIPDCVTPFALAVGNVLSSTGGNVNGVDVPKSFLLSTSAYIDGASQTFNVKGLFANKKRWAHTPSLSNSSALAFSGSFLSFSPTPGFTIAVDDIALNISPSSAPAAQADSPRRKFTPFTPVTAGSSSSQISTEATASAANGTLAQAPADSSNRSSRTTTSAAKRARVD